MLLIPELFNVGAKLSVNILAVLPQCVLVRIGGPALTIILGFAVVYGRALVMTTFFLAIDAVASMASATVIKRAVFG
jgi:hypothetical protein